MTVNKLNNRSSWSRERCEIEEWREGTRGEAVYGVKQVLAYWLTAKTWLSTACHWCALIGIIPLQGAA